MNWVDYAILVVLALSVLIGLMRGLVTEVLALVIWLAAFWVAWAFGPAVAAYFRGHVDLPSARIIIGYGLCFLAVLLLGALLRFAISRLVEGTGLSGTDRLLGMVFGLVRGAFLVALCVLLLGFTPFTRDPWWQQSQLLPTFENASGWMARQLPAAVQRYLHPAAPSGPSILRTALPLRASAPTLGSSEQVCAGVTGSVCSHDKAHWRRQAGCLSRQCNAGMRTDRAGPIFLISNARGDV